MIYNMYDALMLYGRLYLWQHISALFVLPESTRLRLAMSFNWQPGSNTGPQESFEIKTNNVDSSTQTLPDDSSVWPFATTVVNSVVPSHSNFVNKGVSPPSPEGSGGVSPFPFLWTTRLLWINCW